MKTENLREMNREKHTIWIPAERKLKEKIDSMSKCIIRERLL